MKFIFKVFVLLALIVISRLDREKWVDSRNPVKYRKYTVYSSPLKTSQKPVQANIPHTFPAEF